MLLSQFIIMNLLALTFCLIGWQTLGVEGQVHPASTSINNTEEQEPLILTTSAMDSYNNSPLLVLKKYPSQRSISPSAFSFSTAIESSVLVPDSFIQPTNSY